MPLCECGCGATVKRRFAQGHNSKRSSRALDSSSYTVEDREHDTPCWVWNGPLTERGYGLWHSGTRRIRAHRAMYELHRGPIPPGLEPDHLCRVHACVRPDHLEPVTHRENLRRGRGGTNTRSRTHCPQGHPYDEANTLLYRGRRYCRACHLERTRRRRHQKAPQP